jgi:hypothetical protein
MSLGQPPAVEPKVSEVGQFKQLIFFILLPIYKIALNIPVKKTSFLYTKVFLSQLIKRKKIERNSCFTNFRLIKSLLLRRK